jgi:hypothetical protein
MAAFNMNLDAAIQASFSGCEMPSILESWGQSNWDKGVIYKKIKNQKRRKYRPWKTGCSGQILSVSHKPLCETETLQGPQSRGFVKLATLESRMTPYERVKRPVLVCMTFVSVKSICIGLVKSTT